MPKRNNVEFTEEDERKLQKAVLLRDHFKWEESIDILEPLFVKYPENIPTIAMLAYSYRQVGNYIKSIELYSKAIRLKPRRELLSLGLFHSFWQSGNYRKAIKEAKRFQSLSHSDDYEEILNEIREKWGDDAIDDVDD